MLSLYHANASWVLYVEHIIDYIYVQTVIFWYRRAAWQFPTPDIFPAVRQGLMLAYEHGSCTYLNQLDTRKPWWYLFHKQVKGSFSTAPEIFKPLLKCSIFKCISWLNCSFFGCDRGFLKEGVKTYRMAPISPLNSSFFFSLHIYSLCDISDICGELFEFAL